MGGKRDDVTYGRKKKPKPPPWSEEEEQHLIDSINDYYKDDRYGLHGTQYPVMAEIAERTGRSAKAVRAKYEQLRRKGRIK